MLAGSELEEQRRAQASVMTPKFCLVDYLSRSHMEWRSQRLIGTETLWSVISFWQSVRTRTFLRARSSGSDCGCRVESRV